MKVTNEIFLQRISILHPNIKPLEPYKGNDINILCHCNVCGHEWMVRPNNLLSGKGCPVCARNRNAVRQLKTQDDFITELNVNNPHVEPLEPYNGINRKILFRCKKCGYEWSTKPCHVLKGHACPVCGGSMRKDHNTFIEQLSKVNPMIEVLEPYINARTKILCRCSCCKNEWYGTPDKLLQGNGCPICDRRNKTSFPEQAIYFYLKMVYSDVVNRYYLPNTKTEIDIFIPSLKLGIEYDGVYWHKSKAMHETKKYHICKENGITLYRVRESTEIINDIADDVFLRDKPYNFITLDNVLRNLFSTMGLQINVNTFEDSSKIRAQFFTELSNKSLYTLYPDIAKEWHPDKNGSITPKMISYGSNEKYWWKCKTCNHEWMAAVSDRTVGEKGCPQCNRNELSKKYAKKNEVFVKQLQSANPNLEPMEKYKTTHEKILIHCKVCGYVWRAAPANLLRGRGCPVCSRKRGSKKISATKQDYYNNLRDKKDKKEL